MSNKIKKFLKYAQEQYTLGTPIIPDDVFDHLAKKYDFYEVGATPISNRVRHYKRMYSLQKIFVGENKEPSYTSKKIKSIKLDGNAISLLYVNGILSQGATRGDGIEGEDITDKVLMIDSIPSKLKTTEAIIQITGEVLAAEDVENSRNYVAGALHLKDIEEFKTRKLIFIAYGIEPYIFPNYDDDMVFLQEHNFYTILDSITNKFPTDGTVYRTNSNKEFYSLGFTSKHPRGAYALKDRKDVNTEETILREVKWQVGKGGKVTPVAIFDEIVIDDAKINRATLHNVGFIEELGLELGDTILITRAGGIIPKVVGVL